ncbi:hypothetical protein CS022_07435 [Veronia nyctiphanis]|uniref:OmpA-like domain-containing protein n=1 Tax=Veronia nyctiphanis TaxID=1278244 RepID=A0A4Q0YRL2_9GAMM|nr:OmpA family protein [Veronia nyctiphanis]RXJ73820.1 hypothetical protein CS022_07435 [Veronia nyctiphanis]
MKTSYLIIASLLTTGCVSKPLEDFYSTEIPVMPDSTPQIKDLRDFDNDGVIESREDCEETIRGAIVTNSGCPDEEIGERSIRLDVKFANNSTKLTPEYTRNLEELANFMARYPKVVVEIEGHASTVGNAGYNQRLSQRRATAVAESLVNDFGISASRVRAVGYGESRPLIKGNTDIAHQQNRRVMAKLNTRFEKTAMKWTIYTDDKKKN